MEFLNDRTAYARKTRTVLNTNWQKHISDTYGLGYDMPPIVRRPHGRRLYAAVPKATFSFAMALFDKVGGWNEEKWMGSNLIACT